MARLEGNNQSGRADGPRSRVEIVRQVAGALDVARQQGVVHRDLKSDNIMLSQTNGSDWARFSISESRKFSKPKREDVDITAANLVIGTPQYMSPEQWSQAGRLMRVRIYSLNNYLRDAAGRVPFTGESPTIDHDECRCRGSRRPIPGGSP